MVGSRFDRLVGSLPEGGSRRTMLKALVGGMLAPAAALLAPLAAAAAVLGGVDLQAYCRSRYPRGGVVLLGRRDAYSWKCRSGSERFYPINMDQVCRAQYGRGTYAQTRNPSNPYSWRCYR